MNKITDFFMGDILSVVDINNNVFEGTAVAILWEDETDGEAHLSLETKEGLVEFDQSDIASIQEVHKL